MPPSYDLDKVGLLSVWPGHSGMWVDLGSSWALSLET